MASFLPSDIGRRCAREIPWAAGAFSKLSGKLSAGQTPTDKFDPAPPPAHGHQLQVVCRASCGCLPLLPLLILRATLRCTMACYVPELLRCFEVFLAVKQFVWRRREHLDPEVGSATVLTALGVDGELTQPIRARGRRGARKCRS